MAGYGEIELDLCNCLAAALNMDTKAAVKVMFSRRGEERRINTADETMAEHYKRAGLEPTYTDAIAHAHWCRKIRNQYSHCHWGDDQRGLWCVLVEHAVKNDPSALEADKLGITVSLLESQEQFFKAVLQSLWYLSLEFQRRAGVSTIPVLPVPPKLSPPPLYNPTR